MHNYAAAHGRLPPAVVYGEDGKPLLSWRVLLLPYTEQADLYKEFRLNEPWDSPHNIRLLERMPSTYAPPPGKARKVPPHHTVMHVFFGKGAAFEGREGLRLNHEDFPDGMSYTILVIEGGPPVPWTKPENLPFAPGQPLPDLPPLFKQGYRVGFADGSMRWVPKDLSEADLRAAITRNGGEEFKSDF